MFDTVRRTLRELRGHTSGNAFMMVAIGLPALVASAGLAVDASQWFMWKRELQHSVDQAAIAGAIALSDPDSGLDYEDRALQEYDANLSVTTDFDVDRPQVSVANFGGGVNNSVVVVSSARRMLPFTSLITGTEAVVNVSAQATFAEGGNYSACIVTHTTGNFGGNSTVTAPCGIGSLYCPEPGSPNADVAVIDIAENATVETNVIVACASATVNIPDDLEDKVKHAQLTDDYASLTPPTNNTPRTYACSSGKTKIASPQPGTYNGLVVKCTTVFAPGIYVINGGELDLTANYNVTGNGVMFVLKGGARLKLGGHGNGNRLNLTPMEANQFVGTPYEDQADKYAGMLVFEDRSNRAINPGHKINGNSESTVEGVIYLPANGLEIEGTANVSSQCLVLSAKSLRVLGNADLTTMCPSDTGAASATLNGSIRLVA